MSSFAAFYSQIRASRVFTVVASLWLLTFLIIGTHSLVNPTKNTVFPTYREAGTKWLKGDKIYKNNRKFVYSPLGAAFFAPFAAIPLPAANIAWRLLTTGVYVGAIVWWLRAGLHRGITRHLDQWVFLLLLPLSLGNIHNAQINPLIIGLLMVAILACREGLWTLSALAIGLATYFKIYPLAVGLLLLILYPRQLLWRLVLVLIGMGALTFILQKPDYVWQQYELWIKYRMQDNRFEYKDENASRDFWMVLRFLQIPITQGAYQILQVASGGAIAILLLVGRIRQWPQDRLIVALFALVSCWMLLFGPSTESATYIMMAPAIALALVQACAHPERYSKGMRYGIIVATIVSVIALEINALISREWVDTRTPPFMSIQPIGALLFLGYTLAALRSKYWTKETLDAGAEQPVIESKGVVAD